MKVAYIPNNGFYTHKPKPGHWPEMVLFFLLHLSAENHTFHCLTSMCIQASLLNYAAETEHISLQNFIKTNIRNEPLREIDRVNWKSFKYTRKMRMFRYVTRKDYAALTELCECDFFLSLSSVMHLNKTLLLLKNSRPTSSPSYFRSLWTPKKWGHIESVIHWLTK